MQANRTCSYTSTDVKQNTQTSTNWEGLLARRRDSSLPTRIPCHSHTPEHTKERITRHQPQSSVLIKSCLLNQSVVAECERLLHLLFKHLSHYRGFSHNFKSAYTLLISVNAARLHAQFQVPAHFFVLSLAANKEATPIWALSCGLDRVRLMSNQNDLSCILNKTLVTCHANRREVFFPCSSTYSIKYVYVHTYATVAPLAGFQQWVAAENQCWDMAEVK